jgi:hypothetical protein
MHLEPLYPAIGAGAFIAGGVKTAEASHSIVNTKRERRGAAIASVVA